MKLSKRFINLILLAIFGIVLWTAFSIYFTVSKRELTDDVAIYLIPIDREFDRDVIEELNERIEGLPIQPEVFHRYEDVDFNLSIEDTSEVIEDVFVESE